MDDKTKIKQFKKPYISVLIIGTGIKELLSDDDGIIPNNVFFSSSFSPIRLDHINNVYKLNINTRAKETNITF